MPDISLTRNTQLRGGELQAAVSTMISELSRRSPYSLVSLSHDWASATQVTLSAPGYVSGTITLRDGNPSTVTVQMDLSGAARSMRDRVIRDMNAMADQYLAGTAPAAATAAAAEAEESRPRREFDWGLFGSILSDITTGVATGLSSMNEAYAQTTAEQAVAVASDTAAAATGKQVFDGGVLYPGEEVSGKAPPPSLQLTTPVMAQNGGTPSWVWWALGIGGAAAAVGLIVYLARR